MAFLNCRFLNRRFLNRRTLTSLLLAGCVLPATLNAQPESQASEYRVKAAILYNFAKFVVWPDEEADGQGKGFVIGILGTDPFGAAIDEAVGGKLVRGRPIEVKRMRDLPTSPCCHILFVGTPERKSVNKSLLTLRGAPVLTVSDMEDFSENGGMITLLLRDGRIRFAINPAAAERSGLRISSKLLALAQIVDTGPAQP